MSQFGLDPLARLGRALELVGTQRLGSVSTAEDDTEAGTLRAQVAEHHVRAAHVQARAVADAGDRFEPIRPSLGILNLLGKALIVLIGLLILGPPLWQKLFS